MKLLFKKAVAVIVILLSACTTQKEEVEKQQVSTNINPPIKGLENKFDTYLVNNLEGRIITTPKGSKITIPKNAFLSKDGTKINANIEIKFREYHNAIDLFLSGIPMEYNAEGNKENFETAGMFEIQAELNGEQVIFAPNKNVKVELASFQTENNYRFFQMQENNKDWTYIGENDLVLNTEKTQKLDSIIKLKKPLENNYLVLDHMGLADIYFNNNRDKIKKVKRNSITKKFQEYNLDYLNTDNKLAIEYKGRDFPASMMVWENIGRKFPQKYLGGRKYDSKMTNVGENKYFLELFKKGSEKKVFATTLMCYMPIKQLISFPALEWKENRTQILAKLKAEEERLKLEADCFRTFKINDFGIYNWDRFLKQELSIKVKPNFVFETPVDSLNNITVYCVVGDDNAIITVNYKDKITLGPSNTAQLFAILPGNQLALFNNEMYREIDFEGLHETSDKLVTFLFKNKGEITSRDILEKLLVKG